MSKGKYMNKKDYFKVFDAFAAGKSNDEIAASIQRSPMTIRRARNYLAAAYEGRLRELRVGKHSAALVGYVSEYALLHPLSANDAETPACEELPEDVPTIRDAAPSLSSFACRFCSKEGSADCLYCSPSGFVFCTRYEFFRKSSVEEFAKFLEKDLYDGVPTDFLKWLTEPLTFEWMSEVILRE